MLKAYLFLGLYFLMYQYMLKLQLETTGPASAEYRNAKKYLGAGLIILFIGITILGLI